MIGAFVQVGPTGQCGYVVTECGCWEWVGATSASGYGRAKHPVSRRMAPAHRIVWESVHGSVPSGLQLDHLCRNVRCVRPDHLEPVTPRENTLRSYNPTAINARKTHCPVGHEFSGRDTRGQRKCVQCRRASDVRRRAGRIRFTPAQRSERARKASSVRWAKANALNLSRDLAAGGQP